MTDGHNERDEFDEWLRNSVEPLPPPPGTYERVRRQARHRRLAKALTVGAAAAVVVAGGVTVPRMIQAGRPQPYVPETSGASPVRTPSSPPQSTRAAPPNPSSPHPSNGPSGDGKITPRQTRSERPAAPPRCHTGDLSVRLTRAGAGAGQRYTGVVLTNTSSHKCTLLGYVGVGFTSPDGPVPTTLTRDSGPRPRITVPPGESAATTLHWSAIPAGDETDGCKPKPTTILVTPPDETTQLTAAWPYGALCQHGELHTVPLIKGTSPPPI